jgi:hypothetical protein
MNLFFPLVWAVGPARPIVVAQQGGNETPGWLTFLIGIAGVVIGGLLTFWGNQLSAGREEGRRKEDHRWEEKRRNQDRLWEEKRKLYETIVLWIARRKRRCAIFTTPTNST